MVVEKRYNENQPVVGIASEEDFVAFIFEKC